MARKISELPQISAEQVQATDKILLARQQGDNVIVSYEDLRKSFASQILEQTQTVQEFQNFQLFLADQ